MSSTQKLDAPEIVGVVSEQRQAQVASLPEPWRYLTTLPEKVSAYSLEPYFREAWDDLVCAYGGERSAAVEVQRLVLVTLKPDALAGRRVERIVDFLRRHAFEVVLCYRHRLTPTESREIWRYQWNVATLDRLALWDLIIGTSPCLVLVVKDKSEPFMIPAAVRLRGLKGSAVLSNRSGQSLRDAAGAPNRILTMLHAVDEPVDVVRELGITLSGSGRRRLIARIKSASAANNVLTVAGQLDAARKLPFCEFNYAVSENALRMTIDDIGSGVGRWLALNLPDDHGSWPFRRWLVAAAGRLEALPIWDVITVASYTIQHDIQGEVCTIDLDGRAEWLSGLGYLLTLDDL